MDYSEQLESSCFHSLRQIYFLPTTHTLGAEEGGNREMLVAEFLKVPIKACSHQARTQEKGNIVR